MLQKEDEFRPPRQALYNSTSCEQPLWKVGARVRAQDDNQYRESGKRGGKRKPRGDFVHRRAKPRGARAAHALGHLCKVQPRPKRKPVTFALVRCLRAPTDHVSGAFALGLRLAFAFCPIPLWWHAIQTQAGTSTNNVLL